MILCSINLSLTPDLTTFFGDNNIANYQNDEVRSIMEEVKNTTDENTLVNKYKRLAEIYKEDVPYISLYNNKYTVAYFEARVNNRGNIKSFTLSLNAFDENEQYVGRVGYTYKKIN